MPELPEVEITARLLGGALRGARVESALAPGINVLKNVDPPLSELNGRTVEAVRRRGKHLIVDFSGDLALLIHLMSAGRLQLWETRAGPRERTSRLLVRVRASGAERELRLREFGSKQAAWAKLLRSDDLEGEHALASLGPEAWPDTPDLDAVLSAPRPLNALLRDQRAIAGIGRSWADEILWQAGLSPYRRARGLVAEERERLREAIGAILGAAVAHYERTLSLPIPDKLPMPLRIHRHLGEPCPRCGEPLCGVHFEENVISYCPRCQTGGRKLKDRRMSRLLK